MSSDTTLKLAHNVENIMGIKEACGSLNQISYILRDRPDGFKVISGDDAMAHAIITMGGDGVISVAANAFPSPLSAMVAAAFNSNLTISANIHLNLTEMIDALFVEGNPTGVKAAMAIKGLISNYLRLPLVAASEELEVRLRLLMERYSL